MLGPVTGQAVERFARRIVLATAASLVALSLAGCDGAGAADKGTDAGGTRKNDVTIGLLLPEKTNRRFETLDHPAIKAKVEALTEGKGTIDYANAEANAQTQATQMQEMIARKVDIILLDAVDSSAIANMVTMAKEAGIPVIAYDRLAEGPIEAYVSFDNELIGEAQGRTLVESLGSGDHSSDKIVMINGPSNDSSANEVKAGALEELEGKVTIASSFETLGWNPEIAESSMAEAIQALGADDIAGVYAANDSLAAGVIEAFRAAGVTDIPPVTGQDAELTAVQRIVSGDQHMSVYKSYRAEAEAAAEMALAKIRGQDIRFDSLTQDRVDSPTTKDIPSHLLPIGVLTEDSIEDTVVADGLYTVADICTAEYRADCSALGLT